MKTSHLLTAISFAAVGIAAAHAETLYCTGTSASMQQVQANNQYQYLTVVVTAQPGGGSKLEATRKADGAYLLATRKQVKGAYLVDTEESSFANTDDSQLFLDPSIQFDEHQIAISYHGPEAIHGHSTDTYLNCNAQGWK
jgi:hypothetical protein